MRFAILVLGAIVCGVYWYNVGAVDSSLLDVDNKFGIDHFEGYYHRYLSDDTNDTCTDSAQDDICIGFGADSCKRLANKDLGYLVLVVMGLLYLFVGIAIVCDELFVPALEIIAEKMELSNDVAGATLMAAGGSAPELATSFVGTFKRSDIGFGTIVGSAVFNVLFVIGMCVMFTPDKFAPLKLTWWPLFRDCTYYVLTLATLAVFMYDGEIELYEAIIQLAMYFGYVAMMSQSEYLEKYITDNYLKPSEKHEHKEGSSYTEVHEDGSGDEAGVDDVEMIERNGSDKELADTIERVESTSGKESVTSFVKPSTFRVGILQLLTSKQSIVDTAGIAFISKIKGDVNEVFDQVDENSNGELEPEELKKALQGLGTPDEELGDDKIEEMMKAMDPEGKGYVTKAAFTLWYTGNEQRLRNDIRSTFDKYDTDGKSTIERKDVVTFMSELGHSGVGAQERIEAAAKQIKSTCEDPNFLTYEDFTEWYEASLYWEADKAAADMALEAQESMFESIISGFNELSDPEVPVGSKINFCICLPLTLLCCTIPDCRPPGQEYLASYTLIMSIAMIAFFAIIMVELAEIFGKSVGIPDVVMGLTILAAGTSVPDLLSSVIVAQQGNGDMAVSSSIGSNIFDVAFGLPLPWLVFNIVVLANNCNCNVMVGADGLFISLLILLFMVGAIVVIIHFSEWKMTYTLGYAMFILYFVYVAVSLAITPASDYAPDNCSPFSLM